MNDTKGRKKKDIDYNSPFATRLRTLIDERGVTLPAIAESVGVSRQAVGQWKAGNTLPDILDFEKLANFFNVSMDYLIGKSKSRKVKYQEVCELLNISGKAVEGIKEIKYDDHTPLSPLEFFDKLCSSGDMKEICYTVSSSIEVFKDTMLGIIEFEDKIHKLRQEEKQINDDSFADGYDIDREELKQLESEKNAAEKTLDYCKWLVMRKVESIMNKQFDDFINENDKKGW